MQTLDNPTRILQLYWIFKIVWCLRYKRTTKIEAQQWTQPYRLSTVCSWCKTAKHWDNMLRDKAISCAHKKSSEVSKSIVDNFLLFWDNLNWKLVVLLKHSLNYFRTFDSAFISIAIERKNRWVGGHKFYNFYRRFYTQTCTLIALFLSFFLLRSLTPSLSQFQFFDAGAQYLLFCVPVR